MEKQNNLYFTIWYGVHNRRTRRLRYASGGHPPALLYDADGRPVSLMTQNVFIGGFPGVAYEEAVIEDVSTPARLYIFSDGAYEVDRPTGEMWTLEDLSSYLADKGGAGGQEIEDLYAFLQEMHGKAILEDDFSMLKVSLL
jgi:sigma-B regulation protein RsbU (phosphoserine phosphatase)